MEKLKKKLYLKVLFIFKVGIKHKPVIYTLIITILSLKNLEFFSRLYKSFEIFI